MEFKEFPKIPRLSRDVVISEKIDGTNGCILITESEGYPIEGAILQEDGLAVFAGSRTRWITPEQDNHGFAKWVLQNKDELYGLGIGLHHGEWWGQGIQRGYGLKEKRFSLFNTHKWSDDAARPACCCVVPVLYTGVFDTATIDNVLRLLAETGSHAAPGFARPEGIVIYHTAGNLMFKKTILNDEKPKGQTEREATT